MPRSAGFRMRERGRNGTAFAANRLENQAKRAEAADSRAAGVAPDRSAAPASGRSSALEPEGCA
ncbi:hypothetical protein QUV01_22720, partial [Xanthomonas citri pv. citri]